MTRHLAALLILTLLTSGTRAQSAPTPDPIAKDATDLFWSLCLNTLGDREKVASILDQSSNGASKLPDDAVLRLQGGASGGVAWALRSPRNASLLLEFTAAGVCSVRVAKVDGTALQADIKQLLDGAAAGGNIAYRTMSDTASPIDGGDRHDVAYLLAAPALGRAMNVTVSSTNSNAAEQQAVITFGFTSDKF